MTFHQPGRWSVLFCRLILLLLLLLIFLGLPSHSLSTRVTVNKKKSTTIISSYPSSKSMSLPVSKPCIVLSESIWRNAAKNHSQKIRDLLLPGLTSNDRHLNSGGQPKKSNTDEYPITALNPKHPIYNFLIEYYGLKGTKGVRRLMRWSPNPGLLVEQTQHQQQQKQQEQYSGILLEGAMEDDFSSTLHLKGATICEEGVIYSPELFFGGRQQGNNDAFYWYQSILQQTLDADPILHCYGLHEWAMQYQPDGAPPPPSAKYQKHLPLRVSRQVLNETVERKGISCTHVDALRFFAQPALPLNKYGGPLERIDQKRLEQPGCVHATMDLLKMTLKLQPFCDAELLRSVLGIALEARELDVAASPYDASQYDVSVIPIETSEGRAEYKRRQTALMKKADPIRRELLKAYDNFIMLAFDNEDLARGFQHLPQKT